MTEAVKKKMLRLVFPTKPSEFVKLKELSLLTGKGGIKLHNID